MADTKTTTYTLKHPIPVGDDGTKQIESITWREPRAKDFRAFRADGSMTVGDMLDFFGRLIEKEPSSILDNFKGEDTRFVIQVAGDFLQAALATSTKP